MKPFSLSFPICLPPFSCRSQGGLPRCLSLCLMLWDACVWNFPGCPDLGNTWDCWCRDLQDESRVGAVRDATGIPGTQTCHIFLSLQTAHLLAPPWCGVAPYSWHRQLPSCGSGFFTLSGPGRAPSPTCCYPCSSWPWPWPCSWSGLCPSTTLPSNWRWVITTRQRPTSSGKNLSLFSPLCFQITSGQVMNSGSSDSWRISNIHKLLSFWRSVYLRVSAE